MSKLRHSARLSRDDRGSSLIEVVLTVGLLGLVLAMVQQTLLSTQSVVEKELDRGQTIDYARTALTQMERQIRSGNLFYDPSDESPAGMGLRIYTQANADSNPSYPNRCVQWRIHLGSLETRQWSPSWDTDGYTTGFRTITEGIVNVERGVTAFDLDTSQTQYGNRLVKIIILVNTDPDSGSDARVEVSVTGRNTGFGFPVTSCDDVPPIDEQAHLDDWH